MPDAVGSGRPVRYQRRDFWSEENLRYRKPHLRMEKAAKIISRLAAGQDHELLDVGCGPATLKGLLPANVHYHGLDIAIQESAPYLLEADLLKEPIRFGNRTFDIAVAQGFFEYVGEFQEQKFAEIAAVLAAGGRFVTSYVNFGHRDRDIYAPYNNVQPLPDFRQSLARYFRIDRMFPTSYNWHHREPLRQPFRAVNMRLNATIPVLAPRLAVQYLFICSPRPPVA